MANRLNTVAPTIYSGVTKVIISDGTPKKVGTVLTINAADFISAGSGGALTGAINLALSNANSNPQLSSAKSLKGYAKVPGTIFV
ncbi:hypothetical protein FACS1894147_09210 [Spirochaetia bacterium]|nr:hypothetical protein FACS1894147_09210 [Spirochaetia bacterium]